MDSTQVQSSRIDVTDVGEAASLLGGAGHDTHGYGDAVVAVLGEVDFLELLCGTLGTIDAAVVKCENAVGHVVAGQDALRELDADRAAVGVLVEQSGRVDDLCRSQPRFQGFQTDTCPLSGAQRRTHRAVTLEEESVAEQPGERHLTDSRLSTKHDASASARGTREGGIACNL
jgi:hypothetical protein